MPHFRLYFLDPFFGHIDAAEDVEATEDSDAVRLAAMRAGDVPVELWRDGRKVARFDAAPERHSAWPATPANRPRSGPS